MIEGAQITVTTTATPLFSSSNSRANGATAVTNRGATTVYLGGPTVTSAAGWQLDAGQTVSLNVDTGNGDLLYGITASGSSTIHVLRAGR